MKAEIEYKDVSCGKRLEKLKLVLKTLPAFQAHIHATQLASLANFITPAARK